MRYPTFKQSKDGRLRATVAVPFRIGQDDIINILARAKHNGSLYFAQDEENLTVAEVWRAIRANLMDAGIRVTYSFDADELPDTSDIEWAAKQAKKVAS